MKHQISERKNGNEEGSSQSAYTCVTLGNQLCVSASVRSGATSIEMDFIKPHEAELGPNF